MTTAEQEQLNRFLAEKVLGWREVLINDVAIGHEAVWMDTENRERYVVMNWRPTQRLSCCEPLLDKIEQDGYQWKWECELRGGYTFELWNFELWKPKLRYGEGWSEDCRTEALCLAVAQAYGWPKLD